MSLLVPHLSYFPSSPISNIRGSSRAFQSLSSAFSSLSFHHHHPRLSGGAMGAGSGRRDPPLPPLRDITGAPAPFPPSFQPLTLLLPAKPSPPPLATTMPRGLVRIFSSTAVGGGRGCNRAKFPYYIRIYSYPVFRVRNSENCVISIIREICVKFQTQILKFHFWPGYIFTGFSYGH